MEEQVKEVREHFKKEYLHVHIDQIDDNIISEYLERDYVKNLRFPNKMYCLYDYILAQGLCDVTE